VSEAVKTIRTCQNSLGQNGTRLGLLLLLVGPNGDGFGGQAFMEHYTTTTIHRISQLTSFCSWYWYFILGFITGVK
jgi:hypothetical protein